MQTELNAYRNKIRGVWTTAATKFLLVESATDNEGNLYGDNPSHVDMDGSTQRVLSAEASDTNSVSSTIIEDDIFNEEDSATPATVNSSCLICRKSNSTLNTCVALYCSLALCDDCNLKNPLTVSDFFYCTVCRVKVPHWFEGKFSCNALLTVINSIQTYFQSRKT